MLVNLLIIALTAALRSCTNKSASYKCVDKSTRAAIPISVILLLEDVVQHCFAHDASVTRISLEMRQKESLINDHNMASNSI